MNYNTIIFGGSLSTVNISIMGYNYNWLTSVYLSSGDVLFPSLTSIDRFTNLRRVSSICPEFSGYKINTYTVLDKNRLQITLNSNDLSGTGFLDIIFEGPAGYTKLTDKDYIVCLTAVNVI